MNIILFSRPVRSGKTSELMQWCSGRNSVSGILMPDKDGQRKMMNIRTGETFDAQCLQPEQTTKELIRVGSFHFYRAAFEKANNILIESIAFAPKWIVIDEVGKLELEQKGFHFAVVQVLKQALSSNIILVVRESLLKEIISSYQLHNCHIVSELGKLPTRSEL